MIRFVLIFLQEASPELKNGIKEWITNTKQDVNIIIEIIGA